MFRFFVNSNEIFGDQVKFDSAQSHKIKHVLRLGNQDKVLVFDNSANEYSVEIIDAASPIITGRITEKFTKDIYPEIKISVYLSPLKKENFEWALQKCTEIGVFEFVPTVYSRTIVNYDLGNQRLIRWQRIITEASEQSRRTILPELINPMPYPEAIIRSRSLGFGIIPWESEKTMKILDVLKSATQNDKLSRCGLFIGPEGGITQDEINLAKQNGLMPVTLGKNILRAETAAIVASTLIAQVI